MNTKCLILLLWYLNNSVFVGLWDKLSVKTLLRTEYQRKLSVYFISCLLHTIVSYFNLQANSSQSDWQFKYHLCTYNKKTISLLASGDRDNLKGTVSTETLKLYSLTLNQGNVEQLNDGSSFHSAMWMTAHLWWLKSR